MRLHVICGHGAGDPGAVGGGYTEAERVRALGAAIKDRGGDSVVLLDTSRNWYADKGVETLSIPKGDALVELHMDSAIATSARGGHVVIKAGVGGADAYDRALAKRISEIFPGRSSAIVERSDLANANRAAARGINYRLVEHGFISNDEDRAVFNARINDIADAYLEAFGIKNEEDDMTAEQAKMLEEIHAEVFRTEDPTGRGRDMLDHDHIKWIAVAVQNAVDLLKQIAAKVGVDVK